MILTCYNFSKYRLFGSLLQILFLSQKEKGDGLNNHKYDFTRYDEHPHIKCTSTLPFCAVVGRFIQISSAYLLSTVIQ